MLKLIALNRYPFDEIKIKNGPNVEFSFAQVELQNRFEDDQEE